MMLAANPIALLPLLPWAALWLVGGWLLAQGCFRLPSGERWIVGFALGWFAQIWLCNLLGMILPLGVSSWLAAGTIFMLGMVLWLRYRQMERLHVPVAQLALLGGVTLLYFSISRGMAIFDDFQHLATVSLIAAGDFPPRFALDPSVRFGYHHFLQLFAAQLSILGGLAPWAAVDGARALAFGLAVMLGGLWAERLTGRAAAGWLGGLFIALAGGTRWLLLLLPRGFVIWIGSHVQLLGSGAGSGPNLQEALLNAWAVEGAGPTAFPFAFANGIFPYGVVMGHTANGLAVFASIFLILLTVACWKNHWSAVLTAVVVSTWGLLGEAELAAFAAGTGLIAAVYAVRNRSLRLPSGLRVWLAVMAAGTLIGLLSGGAWTDMLAQRLAGLMGQPAPVSYQTVGFEFTFPPAVISSHLGALPLFHPATLFVALLEMGPVLLVLPLLVVWGWKALGSERWFEAVAAGAALFTLLMIFIHITGSTGVRNTPRLYVFLPLCAAFAVPLGWRWAAEQGTMGKTLAAALYGITIFGGVVMLGVQMTAMQRPVYSSFLTALDAQIAQAHWNRLEPGALVFDPNPYRAPVVLGRATDAYTTWYQPKPAWQAMAEAPDPYTLRAYGFRYAYMDERYWEEIGDEGRQRMSDDCVRVADEALDGQGRFRRLLDISTCSR